MVLKVFDQGITDPIYEDDFRFFDDDCDIDKVRDQLREMWRAMCDYRDAKEPGERTFLQIMSSVEADSVEAIALNLNIGQFAKTMTIYVNAYLPKPEGFAALMNVFDNGCFCWPTVDAQYTENGKMEPYSADNKFIYSYNYYSYSDWNHYSMSTIANACKFVPYDLADFSQVCKIIRECPAGMRPMVWVNPNIVQAFIDAKQSKITMENFQAYLSSFIITAALDDGTNEIDDGLATQLWDACRVFAEEEKSEDLIEMFDIAEDLITSR